MLTPEQQSLISNHYKLAVTYSRKSCRYLSSQDRVNDVAVDGLLAAAMKFNPAQGASFTKFLKVSIELRSHVDWVSRSKYASMEHADASMAVPVAADAPVPSLDQRLERAVELIKQSTSLKEGSKSRYITLLKLRRTGLPLYKCAEQMGIHRNQATRIESAILEFFRTELNHDD